MTSAYMKRILDQEAAEKKAVAKRAAPRKVRERLVQAKAPEPAEEEIVRLIFACPKVLADRVKDRWHERKFSSLSATIRALLEEALKP